jgi:phosphoribosyl-ATP pyrophosphohydrolase/phosphoribosyl-AMP cyclohydrolase
MSDLNELIAQVNFLKGLVPVIVQDHESGEVLTLAYMNEEALKETLKTGYAHFFSRSQKRIRMKGEVSGNVQRVKEIRIDCDNDALLLRVEQTGPACHTGNRSCFYRKLGQPENIIGGIDYSLTILRELEELIKGRKRAPKEGSYTSKLLKAGKEEVYKKFGEEAIEVLLAENKEGLIYETADMLYHLLVLLAYNDVGLGEVMNELRRRRK